MSRFKNSENRARSQVATKDMRKHDRFDVSFFEDLVGHTEFGPSDEKLVSLSSGGCGFVGRESDFRFQIKEQVVCTFEWKNELIRVRGEILYLVPQTIQGQAFKFYGVKFADEDCAKMKDVLNTVKDLVAKGKLTRL